jgi:hypothetical protein
MLYYLLTGSHHGRKPCGPKKLRTMEESVELSGALAMHVHDGDACFGIHLESSGIDLVDMNRGKGCKICSHDRSPLEKSRQSGKRMEDTTSEPSTTL